ncbi:ABC transporter ATP-binding protein [Microlunatus soli]|uniref:Putative ABC transport system ATP-binding protein n=1 Tax=Microlunatus soli TaxID=630515 RepID=A0A1H2APG6_9ACTN|nr:ABC transporter ATP-binding protein [Microlunatus soli]SDT47672.1 putative ABC transport system ATP-binding protein [Microlunatus soli]
MTAFLHSPRTVALTVRGLECTYAGSAGTVHALRGVDLDLPHGSFTAIMGPSGSGKSTLLHCAAGLQRPTGGQILLGDTSIAGLDESDLTRLRRTRLGFVFQSFNLLPALTVIDNVELPLRLDGRRAQRSESLALLSAVGLGHRVRHRPAELSGGQQQRVAIARALITHPEIVFADEPTGALDLHSAREVMQLLRRLADQGQTVVMVTHDPTAAAVADNVLFLADGRIVDRLAAPTASTVAGRMAELVALADRGPEERVDRC